MDNTSDMSQKDTLNLNVLSKDFDFKSIIKKHNVDLSPLNLSKDDQPIAFILENIFTPEECKALIMQAEANKFSAASVNYDGVEAMNENLRSGSRVMLDNVELTSTLWSRIESFIPKKVNGAQVVGLNERLRYLKYIPGQFFAPHSDGNYVRPDNQLEVSLLTIQMYLNEDFEGGETTFLGYSFCQNEQQPWIQVPVKPKTGMALVFIQHLLHEGSRVKNGVKYTARTDIMYRYGSRAGFY